MLGAYLQTMDAKLVISTMLLGYVDSNQSNNPQMRGIDWRRSNTISCANPKTQPHTLAAGSTLTLFDGTRTTSIASDTEFTLSLSSLDENRYRLTWTGTGVAPAFRTDRALTPDTHTITVVVNANLSVSLSSSNATEFSAVQVGDDVFIPGTTTGDASTVFSALNQGNWIVIGKNSNSIIQVARPATVDFSGVTETVVVTANSQLQAFSSTGVQVDDRVNISSGFSASVQNIFTVIAVNPSWVEFESSAVLPVSQTAVPGVSGVTFYTDAKSFVHLEVTQDAVVRLNGDTSNCNRVSPWSAGDINSSGTFEKAGPTWKMDVVNLSSQTMEIVLITAQ
jgi:hypothetical protein